MHNSLFPCFHIIKEYQMEPGLFQHQSSKQFRNARLITRIWQYFRVYSPVIGNDREIKYLLFPRIDIFADLNMSMVLTFVYMNTNIPKKSER